MQVIYNYWTAVKEALVIFYIDTFADADSTFTSLVSNDSTSIVIKLLKRGGVKTNIISEALPIASSNGNLELVNKLLEYGADVHAQDDRALIDAAKWGRSKIVDKLLKCNANVHAQDNSALISATEHERTEIIDSLLKCGADVHARDDEALMHAVKCAGPKTISKLLEGGANVGARNNAAFILAMESYRMENFNGSPRARKYCTNRGIKLYAIDKLLDYVDYLDADYDAIYDHILRLVIYLGMQGYWNTNSHNLRVVTRLLTLGVSLHRKCHAPGIISVSILENMKRRFNKQIADIIIPFCHSDDHHYFPEAYLDEYFKTTQVLIKSANSMGR